MRLPYAACTLVNYLKVTEAFDYWASNAVLSFHFWGLSLNCRMNNLLKLEILDSELVFLFLILSQVLILLLEFCFNISCIGAFSILPDPRLMSNSHRERAYL